MCSTNGVRKCSWERYEDADWTLSCSAVMDKPCQLYTAIVLCLYFGGVCCLQCWHCIADNCDMEPSDNYKALRKTCNNGQSCQKVFFHMYDEQTQKQYYSTVRGCSTGCQLKDDFVNCTHELRTSRGCVRKDCCHDNDLCNGSDVSRVSVILPVSLLMVVLTLRSAVYAV